MHMSSMLFCNRCLRAVSILPDVDVVVDYERDGSFVVHLNGDSHCVSASLESGTGGAAGGKQLNCTIDGILSKAKVVFYDDAVHIFTAVCTDCLGCYYCIVNVNSDCTWSHGCVSTTLKTELLSAWDTFAISSNPGRGTTVGLVFNLFI